ncbi:MAG TPA: ABC transporter permease [Polyangiales bacterium]
MTARVSSVDSGGVVPLLRAAARAQLQLTRQNIEDLRPVLTMPLVCLVGLAILSYSGRAELASYALVAAVLMTIGQMGNFVASEIVFQERNEQTLELVVASPAPYFYVLLGRVVVLTLLGLVGAVESWLLARLVFHVSLVVHHWSLFGATLLLTCLAAAGTALLTSALFALSSQVRTFQNAINGPLYLLGGVLVPVSYLPAWLSPLSPFVFFSWAADLLRASFVAGPPAHPLLSLAAIAALGATTGALGWLCLGRMLDRLRRQGTLGLT